MQNKQAYFVGALLTFGSAMWGAMFTEDVKVVIALLAAPSLIAGYIYAPSLPQYIWGMLLGICAYMAVEYQIYGPIYKITGLVYAVGFVAAVGCALLACVVYSVKARRENQAIN